MADVATLEKPVIFIVDDDEAVRDSLKLLLETHGMEVEVFASTKTLAQSYVGSSRVDLQACKLEYSIVSPK